MMSSKRWYYTLQGLIVLILLCLIGGAYAIDRVLQKQSQQLVAQRLTSDTLDTQQQNLIKAKVEIKKYQQLGDLARSIVPQDKDQVQTVREIVNIAAAAGVTLNTISFPGSTLGNSSTGASTTTTGATNTPSAAASTKLSQLTPAKTIPGVYDLQITVATDATNTVPYSKFIAFLQGLESNRRTALVSTISLSPSDKDPGQLSFTLVLDEYIKP